MVLPDPDAAIVDALERIEELEKREGIPVAWANAHTLLEARIEAIERLFSGDRGINAWIATTKHHGDQIDGLLGDIERNRKLVARIEALDKRLCGNWADAMDRIEALEGEHLSIAHRTSAMERDRSLHADRWHATYNATLTGLIANSRDFGTTDFQHDEARKAADRAHGPLEQECSYGGCAIPGNHAHDDTEPKP